MENEEITTKTIFLSSPAPNMHKAALVIEGIGEASQELRRCGYECDRITHNELMSLVGEEYIGKLLRGDYSLMWMSTPADWYVRTPGKRANPHWQRLQNWIQRSIKLNMKLIVFAPPPRLSKGYIKY